MLYLRKRRDIHYNCCYQFLTHKKIKKKNPKIQKDIHKESLEDCLSWWLRTKMTSGKVGGQ
jgi:hypothetical protein